MEDRTNEESLQHYRVEVELADKIRKAPREERLKLYVSVYEEVFKRVPNHPQLLRKASAVDSTGRVTSQVRFLKPFLRPDTIFMEVELATANWPQR